MRFGSGGLLPIWLTGFLKSKIAGQLWLAGSVLTLLLIWQQVVGWPLTRAMVVPAPKGLTIQEVRLPSGYPRTDWNNAMLRVTENGTSLPRYEDRDALQSAGDPGYALKGRNVLLRRPDRQGSDTSSGAWKIEVPLVLPSSSAFAICLAFLAWTTLLVTLRNPFFQKMWQQIRGWFAHPGVSWGAWILAVTVAAAAIGIRWWGFSFPNWANDTPTYFDSVFAVAKGGMPMATPDRPFAYPLMMGWILRFIPDLRAIVAAHAVASLCAAAAITAILWWTISRLCKEPLLRAPGRLLAVTAGAAFALNETVIAREWALLSEAWAALFLGGQAVLAWVLTSRQRNFLPALGLYLLFCVCGMLTFFTRANWGFALGLLPLPWLVAACLNNSSLRGIIIWGASGAAVLLMVAGAGFACQARCTLQKPAVSLNYRARALVCWHVPLVRLEIDRRLSSQPDDPLRPVLKEMAQVMDQELALSKATGPGNYPSLGYDADRLFFSSLPGAPLFQRLSIEQRTMLCTGLFKDALLRNPGVYLRKVMKQMGMLFTDIYRAPNIPLERIREGVERSQKAVESSKIIPPPIAQRYAATLNKAEAELSGAWPSAARRALSVRACVIFDFLRSTFVWTLAVPLGVCVAAVLWPGGRRRIFWRTFAPTLCLAAWAAGSVVLSALSTAVTQGLDIQRYIELSMPLALLSQVLLPLVACALIAEVTKGFWSRRSRQRALENSISMPVDQLQRNAIPGVRRSRRTIVPLLYWRFSGGRGRRALRKTLNSLLTSSE